MLVNKCRKRRTNRPPERHQKEKPQNQHKRKPTHWPTIRSRRPKHPENAPHKLDLSPISIKQHFPRQLCAWVSYGEVFGYQESFTCRGTSRLLGVGVLVSEVLRESAEDVLSPLLVSSSSQDWEKQLDEESEDKSTLINRRGVKNSANVAPKLHRSSAGGSYEREEKRNSGGL